MDLLLAYLILDLPAEAGVKGNRGLLFPSHTYLLFHRAKLWVEGLEVVSETAVSVHGGLEVSQRHLTQPVRAYTHPRGNEAGYDNCRGTVAQELGDLYVFSVQL